MSEKGSVVRREGNPRVETGLLIIRLIKDIVEYIQPSQKFLVPNTNSQYGSSETIITEESPFNPLSLYAQTKCDAEKRVLEWGNGISLRLATVFGVSYRQRMDLPHESASRAESPLSGERSGLATGRKFCIAVSVVRRIDSNTPLVVFERPRRSSGR